METSSLTLIHDFVIEALRQLGATLCQLAPMVYTAAIPFGLVRRFSNRSHITFTFDRDKQNDFRDAEYVTYGSALLNRIIDVLREQGRVAKVTLPYDIQTTHQISQRVPLQVANCQINIETLYLQYRPLAQFIVSVDYVSDERKTEIHTCCVDLTTPDEILPNNLDIPPNIESKAPEGRNVLKIPSQAYKTSLDTTLKHVKNLATSKADGIEEAANARLSEEIDKIEAFYTSNFVNPHLMASEKQRKIGNAKAKYALKVDIEPVCSTVIYVPELRYTLRVSSQSHPSISITAPIIYELVHQRVIPPICDVCRGVIHIGHLCLKGKHLVCDVCYQKCSECPAEQCTTHPLERCHICRKGVCSNCIIFCTNCGKATCTDHITSCHVCIQPAKVCEKCALFCFDCKEAHCLKHLEKCVICHKYICNDCKLICKVCKQSICQWHKKECDECRNPVCEKHAKACVVCGKYHCQTHMEQCHLCPAWREPWVCSDCRRRCARCKKITCLSHLYDCPECHDKVCHSCARFCGDCGKVHCLEHLNTCAVCNKYICQLLCSFTCVVGNHTVCRIHKKTCAQCHQTVCELHADTCGVCHQLYCVTHQQVQRCHICLQNVCSKCWGICEECKKITHKEHLFQCATCSKIICVKCFNQCYIGSEILCEQCTIICSFSGCKKPVCHKHSKQCHICGRWFCERHIIFCDCCQKPTCSENIRQCATCQKHICVDKQCHTQCYIGGESLCNNPECAIFCSAPGCQKPVCPKHSKQCHICGRWFCERHIGVCDRCQKPTCSEDTRQCATCQKHICVDKQCHTQCYVGGESLCNNQECTTFCSEPGCQQPVCPKHSKQCHICRRWFCERHIGVCDRCQKPTCSEDIRQCATCQKHICVDKQCHTQCYIGGESLCNNQECAIFCSEPGCQKPVCSKHAQPCHICRKMFCINDIEECAICRQRHCIMDRQTCAHCHQSYCSACIHDDTGYCYTCESLTNVRRKDARLKPLLQELSFITRLSATSYEISENHSYRVIRYKMWYRTYVHVISLSTGKSVYHGQLKK